MSDIKIRIGKDIPFRWKVTLPTGELPQESDKAALKLVAKDPHGTEYLVPIEDISQKGILGSFQGERQKVMGDYTITLWYKYSENETSCVDATAAFELVASTDEENVEMYTDPEGEILLNPAAINPGVQMIIVLHKEIDELKEDWAGYKQKMESLMDKVSKVNAALSGTVLTVTDNTGHSTSADLKGATGDTGARGATGATGARGATGATGAQGVPGPVGPAGPQGERGGRGPQGERGERGATGATGATGAQGPKGDKGEKGDTGAQGPAGPAGPTGAKGATGERGQRGPQGERGERGATGATGATGAQGPKGDKGDKGDTGAQGPVGPAGPTGAKGATGERGQRGPQGERGERGATGATGPAGAQGPKGERGDDLSWSNMTEEERAQSAILLMNVINANGIVDKTVGEKLSGIVGINHCAGFFATKDDAIRQWINEGMRTEWLTVGELKSADCYAINSNIELWDETYDGETPESVTFLGTFANAQEAALAWLDNNMIVPCSARIGRVTFYIDVDYQSDILGLPLNSVPFNLMDVDGLYEEAEAARNFAFSESENARQAVFNGKEAMRDEANVAALAAAETLAKQDAKLSELEGKVDVLVGEDEKQDLSTANLSSFDWVDLDKVIPVGVVINSIKKGEDAISPSDVLLKNSNGERVNINRLPYTTTSDIAKLYSNSLGIYTIDYITPAKEGDVDKIKSGVDAVKNGIASTQILAGGEYSKPIDIVKGATNIEPSTKHDFIIKSGANVVFGASIDGVLTDINGIYLYYGDGTRSNALHLGENVVLDKDVVEIGLYVELSNIIQSGIIKLTAVYQSLTKAELQGKIDDSDKRLVEIRSIYVNSGEISDWRIGDLYYNTTDKIIKKCVSISPLNFVDTDIVSKGILCLYNGIIYEYNGNDLKPISSGENILDGEIVIDEPVFEITKTKNNQGDSDYVYYEFGDIHVANDEMLYLKADDYSGLAAYRGQPFILYGVKNGSASKVLDFGKEIIDGYYYTCNSEYNTYRLRFYVSRSASEAQSFVKFIITNLKVYKVKYGKVNAITPEALPSTVVVPMYYLRDNYLMDKVDVIRSKMFEANGNYDAFVFITDLHWRKNAKNAPRLIEYLQQKVQLPNMIMGGDYADGINVDYLNAFNGFRGNIYRAIGNHEYFNYWDEDSKKNSSGLLPVADVNDNVIWSMYNSGVTDCVIGDANRNYYYVDNKAHKVRYIILNVFADNGNTAKKQFDEEQKIWLGNSISSMPDGYIAVVVAHEVINDFTTILVPQFSVTGLEIANICDAHADKVACIIQGHTHVDLMTKTTGGIPVFVTTCDKALPDNDETDSRSAYIYNKRTLGTINEQAFDIVVINKNAKKVSLVRIGAPADKDGVDFYEVREQTYL